MTMTNDNDNLIDNRHRRFDASVCATVKLTSVPSIVDTVQSAPHRRTAELFVAPHKKRLLSNSHSRSYAKPSENPSLFCVFSSGHPAEPVYVPDELLTATSPLLTDEELPETVRLPRPLQLKEQPPIRRVEPAHKEVFQKTCDFRARRIPMPPRVHFVEHDAVAAEVEEVLRPVFAETLAETTVRGVTSLDTSSERPAVLPFVAKSIKTSVNPHGGTAPHLKIVAPITFTPIPITRVDERR